MKRISKILKHAAILLIAFSLLYFSNRKKTSLFKHDEILSEKSVFDSSSQQSQSAAKNLNRSERSFHKNEFQTAWDEIPKKKLSKSERIALQHELLQKWAEVDLEGALRAALAETWDDATSYFGRFDIESFEAAFKDRPDEAWKLIQSNKLGILESSMIRYSFVELMLKNNPELAFQYASEMDGMNFVKLAGNFEGSDKMSHADMIKKFGQIAENIDLDEIEKKEITVLLANSIQMSHMSKDDILKSIHESIGTLQKSYIYALGDVLSNEKNNDLIDFTLVPENNRADLARYILTNGQNATKSEESLDYLVENQKWEALKNVNVKPAIASIAKKKDATELAEWSLHLPPREETWILFHESVRPYIINHFNDNSLQWAKELPSGDWRDRALAELSQVSLYDFHDEEKSRAALNEISNPTFKAVAEKWRDDWSARQKK